MTFIAPETKLYVLHVRGFLIVNYEDINTVLLTKMQLTRYTFYKAIKSVQFSKIRTCPNIIFPARLFVTRQYYFLNVLL